MPDLARRSAMARPMPREPPVMMAILRVIKFSKLLVAYLPEEFQPEFHAELFILMSAIAVVVKVGMSE